MQRYMDSLVGQNLPANASSALRPILSQLGLIFTSGDYLLLGISLFAGILAALSMAFILGSFAQDTKSAQGVIAPIMVMLLIPYLLTLYLDLAAFSPVLRAVLYAIPFTHTFLAAQNILLGRYTEVLLGDAYLGVIVVVSIFAAAKIFSSDKILTMRLPFGKKKAI
jgi:ABC-2 type transport system permease protein